VGRRLGNECDPRHDEGVVLRQHDTDRRVPARSRERIRADQVVAEIVFAGGDALDHHRGVGLQLDGAVAERFHQLPEAGLQAAVLRGEQEADGRLLDVVGRHVAGVLLALGGDQVHEVGMGLRDVGAFDMAGAVDEYGRLEGGAKGLVAPDRPLRQRRRLG